MTMLARTLALLILAGGCSAEITLLEDASAQYRETKSYSSLESISKQLRKGMARTEIEALLGKGNWYPNDLVVYFSDKQEVTKNNPAREDDDVLGNWVLFLDFKDVNGRMTERLQSWNLELIGE